MPTAPIPAWVAPRKWRSATIALWSAAADDRRRRRWQGSGPAAAGSLGQPARCLPAQHPGRAERRRARPRPAIPIGDGPDFFARVRGLLAEVERAAARPGLARLLEFVLEPEVFRPQQLTERLIAGRALFVRQDIRRLAAIDAAGRGRHAAHRVPQGRRVPGPRRGAVARPDVVARAHGEIAIEAMSPSVFLKQSGVLRRPRFWLQAAIELARLPANLPEGRAHRPRALARQVLVGAAVAIAGRAPADSNRQALAAVIAEGRAQAMAADLPRHRLTAAAAPLGADAPPARDRLAYWEAVYRTPDPWAYGSAYEQLKYRRTLSLLPATPIDEALEVACSEGRFTRHAGAQGRPPRGVGHLRDRARRGRRQRCRDIANVELPPARFLRRAAAAGARPAGLLGGALRPAPIAPSSRASPASSPPLWRRAAICSRRTPTSSRTIRRAPASTGTARSAPR